MSRPVFFLYIDRKHQADPLFWSGLGRALADKPGMRFVVLHDGGDTIQRMLEAQGLPYIDDERSADRRRIAVLVERALREENHRIVAVLNEMMVPVVGLHGIDRSMLSWNDAGKLVSRGGPRLSDLTARGVVPVLSTLCAGRDGVARCVPVREALGALCPGLEEVPFEIVIFSLENRPGIPARGAFQEAVRLSDPSLQGAVPDFDSVARMVAAGSRVLLTSPVGLAADPDVVGTRIGP